MPPWIPIPIPLSPESQTLKSRLINGETLRGLFLLSFFPTLAKITGLTGYDYVVVNIEHSPGSIAEALPCLRTLVVARSLAILRLPELSTTRAKKALSLGPQGLMFPMIKSLGAAELAISFHHFPPHGIADPPTWWYVPLPMASMTATWHGRRRSF